MWNRLTFWRNYCLLKLMVVLLETLRLRTKEHKGSRQLPVDISMCAPFDAKQGQSRYHSVKTFALVSNPLKST